MTGQDVFMVINIPHLSSWEPDTNVPWWSGSTAGPPVSLCQLNKFRGLHVITASSEMK